MLQLYDDFDARRDLAAYLKQKRKRANNVTTHLGGKIRHSSTNDSSI